jgi:shikimate dehydrogenase
VNPEVFALGLIGYPLAKSLSPDLHHAALRASGLRGVYRLYPVSPLPAGEAGLRRMVSRLRSGDLHGLNVTIPHKQNVLAFLDASTPEVEAVGAANTLFVKNGLLSGDNTDIPGFLADLERLLPGSRGRALVLGAGGSARAVVYALAQAGWRITLAARRQSQAEGLLKNLGLAESAAAIPLEAPDLSALGATELIVNTTPVGMHPEPEHSPWPAGVPLPQNAALYDLIYKPAETLLMRQAKAAGLPAFNGLGMLVEQAALAFELWTGARAGRDAMWYAVSMA